jgi:hypothetical protein
MRPAPRYCQGSAWECSIGLRWVGILCSIVKEWPRCVVTVSPRSCNLVVLTVIKYDSQQGEKGEVTEPSQERAITRIVYASDPSEWSI